MRARAAMVALVLLLAGGRALAAGPFGFISAETGTEEAYAVSAGIFQRTTRLQVNGSQFRDFTLRQNQAYVQLTQTGYGLEEYLRLGMANADDGNAFDGGYGPFASVGFRGHLYGEEGARFRVELTGAGTWYGSYKVNGVPLSTGIAGSAKLRDMWDVSAALPVVARVAKGWHAYGGPSFTYGEAKAIREAAGLREKTYAKPKEKTGLFAGVRWTAGKAGLKAEAQFNGKLSAGLEASYAF